MTKKTKRIRPSLASYRELERRLNVANGHIELGTKQLSDLQRKHDIQEKDFFQLLAIKDGYQNELETQKLITKDLISRRSANLLEIANLNRTAAMGFLLAIVVIMVSAYQLFQAYGV